MALPDIVGLFQLHLRVFLADNVGLCRRFTGGAHMTRMLGNKPSCLFTFFVSKSGILTTICLFNAVYPARLSFKI
jgi:hypothetical protein